MLDIRAVVSHLHFDQKYNFPELDHLFIPPKAIPLIARCCRRRRCIWSGLLVQLRCAYHPLLQSILVVNVQSMDNKVDELRARISFERYQGL